MATPEEITTHHEPSTDYDPWVGGPPQAEPIAVVDYDERWPADFERVARTLRAALGDAALAIEHVGSTSVRGLPAKPILDIDLTVADPSDEAAYVPALSNAGFVLQIRERYRSSATFSPNNLSSPASMASLGVTLSEVPRASTASAPSASWITNGWQLDGLRNVRDVPF